MLNWYQNELHRWICNERIYFIFRIINWLLLLWSWHRNFYLFITRHCLHRQQSTSTLKIASFFCEGKIEPFNRKFPHPIDWCGLCFFMLLSWLLIDNEFFDSRVCITAEWHEAAWWKFEGEKVHKEMILQFYSRTPGSFVFLNKYSRQFCMVLSHFISIFYRNNLHAFTVIDLKLIFWELSIL